MDRKIISVAVAGADGYVGRALCGALSQDPQIGLTQVTRANNEQMRQGRYQILINAAMPSKRFWAKSHAEEDFKETVQKTADFLYRWNYEKFVQISSVSARCELSAVYGRHKAAAEKICGKENLIVRLSSMYDERLSKGVLMDILSGTVNSYTEGDLRLSLFALERTAKVFGAAIIPG